jgi:hypothetical protein
MPNKLLGVMVMPEFYQNETIDGVLRRVRQMGATAVATSPYVMEAADERTGGREPPDDAGAGKVRLLDRPLWGRRELWVRTAPSFVPQTKLYDGLAYQPAPPTDLTHKAGGIVRDFLQAARQAKLKIYLQIQAAIPPGYRVQFGGPRPDDQPRLPDGTIPARRLAKNGSLASDAIRAYTHALLRDLCAAYPDLDGVRVDWPEYPPYFLDDVFLDFSEHARHAARRLGYDFARMQREAAALYQLLHGGLTDAKLQRWRDADAHMLLRGLTQRPGLADWLRFKADLSEELLAGFRAVLTSAAGKDKELIAHAFPPPFALASGLDFARAGRHCQGIAMKLYSMHWSMMLAFYGETLLKHNRGLSEKVVVEALVRWFDLADDAGGTRLADYGYPEPHVAHPVGTRVQVKKIEQAQAEAGTTPVYPLVHGYGPPADFRRRLQLAWQASPHGLWINRYGYLSDEKMKLVADVCR